MSTISATQSGSFRLGDTYDVTRLGFGSMQLTGPGVWGDPQDPDQAVRVLRRSVELGVNFIDTADSYGPFVAEQLIRKALYPYADGVILATKAGLTRSGPGDWRPVGRPEYLRQQTELSLRHLGLDRIPLMQLHRIDPAVPLADQLGEFKLLRDEGKIGLIGLSEVNTDQLAEAQKIVEISSVQNLYNVADRSAEDVLDACEAAGIGFIPWFPLATGKLAAAGGPLARIAEATGATPSQLALAWLLRRSPVILPIPGTSSVAHLEENIAAAGVTLSDSAYDELSAAAA
jgi:pyridoxine 4-dehydrogenase